MSYLVLARKYRPRNFESLVGQDHVVRALTHALTSQRLHHAYLFTGTRGVGKTTLSRILAKSLNCEQGITATPCGTCEACQAIDMGRFVDYIEMDAASNRGVDDMTQLLEQAIYAPTAARYKIYMIDEVHMLTREAFNSMLKTLEEPPEYVKFILATTDPQKIPVTVLSRCLQFNLKQLPPQLIVDYLEQILKAENIAFERPALRLLAEGANGSMRDALSLTDQAIAYAAGNLSQQATRDMLGSVDHTYITAIVNALMEKDGNALIQIADDMASLSLSYDAALSDLSAFINRIALFQTAPTSLSDDLPNYKEIEAFSKVFDAQTLQLFYQIIVHGKNELGLAPDEYAGFTMTLLRLLAFMPAAEKKTDQSVKKPSLSQETAKAKSPQPQQTAEVVQNIKTEKTALKSNNNAPKIEAKAPTLKNNNIASKETKNDIPPWMDIPPPTNELSSEMDHVNQDGPQEKLFEKLQAWDENWPDLAEILPTEPIVHTIAIESELTNLKILKDYASFQLTISDKVFVNDANIQKLEKSLADYFECPIKIEKKIAPVYATARQNALEKQRQMQKKAQESIDNDSYVQALLSEFGGCVVPNSIKPLLG